MRARNIKPGFCGDKRLLKCSVEAHLLFPMLWMIADREGRLEDDPEQIELDTYFIVRQICVDGLLSELHQAGVITRYVVDGKKFIQINNFLEHQNPHKNESESEIPAPISLEKTGEAEPLPDGSLHYASTPADSLIPDSLIPDSRIKTSCSSGDERKVGFDAFWQAYPKRVGKGAAEKAWKKIKPTSEVVEAILFALSWQSSSHDWTKDGGQFIPHPATYLNQRRWEDDRDTFSGDIKPPDRLNQDEIPINDRDRKAKELLGKIPMSEANG